MRNLQSVSYITETVDELIEEVTDAVNTTLLPEGFKCVELNLQRNRKTRRLSVVVYHESDMSSGALERLARAIQFEVAMINRIGEISIEVSSPGIERVIKSLHEFEVFKGKTASILLSGCEVWQVVLIQEITGDVIKLRFQNGSRSIPVTSIRKARLFSPERGKEMVAKNGN